MKKSMNVIMVIIFALSLNIVKGSIFGTGKRYHLSKVAVKSAKPEEFNKANTINSENGTSYIEVPEKESLAETNLNTEPAGIFTEKRAESVSGKVKHFWFKKKTSNPETVTVQPAVKKPSRTEIRELKKSLKTAPSGDMFILEVILAFILPPAAVLIHQHDLTGKFWISLLLTLLFWIPGVIFALLVIFDKV